MMKHLRKFSFISSLVAISLMAAPSQAFYIGAEAGLHHVERDDTDNVFEQELAVTTGYVGIPLHPNLGLEAGYSKTSAGTHTEGTTDTELEYKGAYLDLVGQYRPRSSKLTLYATAGAGYYQEIADVDDGTRVVTKDRKLIPRLGLGFGYHFNPHMSARFMARYLDFGQFDENPAVEHDPAYQFTAGVNYHF